MLFSSSFTYSFTVIDLKGKAREREREVCVYTQDVTVLAFFSFQWRKNIT